MKIERIKRKWNQSELAERSNVGLNTIVKIEKGNVDNVSVSILKKLSKALGVPVAELFFSEEE
ncbi:helix-turn-helix transcriptional regulator [Terrisporobacter mayombei]|uniref:helix-turn-helix domain-containing protein n=1 Tax=Terrisporobacter mayombei TaxID=1541 RepID=UPI002F3FC22E